MLLWFQLYSLKYEQFFLNSHLTVCPSDGYVTADSAVGITNQTVVATTSNVSIVTAKSNGNFYGSDCAYVRKGMQLFILVKTGSVFFYPLE